MRIFATLLSVSIFTALPGCRKAEKSVEIGGSALENPDQELWDAEIIFTKDEQVTSILRAKYLAVYESRGLTIADSTFKLDVFNSQGQHTSVITADSGVVKGEDHLTALGNVVVVSDSGMSLKTERLSWDRKLRKIFSDTSVVLTTETDTLYGEGLESDESLQNWEILKPRGKTVRKLAK